MDQQRQMTGQFLAGRHALYGYLYGLVRNTHDAEDLLQEVWVRFSTALGEGKEIRDPAAWCRGTARNLVLHYWRDHRDDKVVVDQELVDLVGQAFAEQDDRGDYWLVRQQALRECLEGLPGHAKYLLRLKYDQGLTAEAVAGRLARTVDAVLKALSRVRQVLRACAQEKLRAQGVAT